MPRIAKKGPRPAPWSVRGVTAEARNAAIAAAHRGQTLGEWLDRAIRQSIKAERAGGAGADPRNHACGAGEDHAGPECPSGGRRGPPRLFGALWPRKAA